MVNIYIYNIVIIYILALLLAVRRGDEKYISRITVDAETAQWNGTAAQWNYSGAELQ